MMMWVWLTSHVRYLPFMYIGYGTIYRSVCSGLIATASGDDAIRIFQEV